MGLNRRGFIKGLSAVFLAPAQAHALPASSKANILNAALAKLTKESDVVLLADSDHEDFSLRAPLNDPSFLASAKKAGITDLYIEITNTFQKKAEDLMAGKITAVQFADMYALGQSFRLRKAGYNPPIEIQNMNVNHTAGIGYAIAENILAAHKAGLKVHLADLQPPDEMTRATIKRDVLKGESGLSERISTYDPRVAELINTTRTGKALVMYGSLHIIPHVTATSNPGNIDDALRALGAKTSTILLTNHLQEAKDMLEIAIDSPEEAMELEIGEGFDIPDFVYSPERREGFYMQAQSIRTKPEQRTKPAQSPSAPGIPLP